MRISWRYAVTAATLAFVAFLAQQPGLGKGREPLDFFKNYFVTGDFIVGGVSLWQQGADTASGNLLIPDTVPDGSGGLITVPPGADIVAAFLYVQTAEKKRWSGIDGATFNGVDLGPGDNSVAKALSWVSSTRPCQPQNGRRLVTYRADVLRYFNVDSNGKPVVNPVAANGELGYLVEVPGAGPGPSKKKKKSSEPRPIGASLVMVYRDPAPTAPLKSIVIYDGGFTKRAKKSKKRAPFQPIRGFYQASDMDPDAKMAQIVGNGPLWDNTTSPVEVPVGADVVNADLTPYGLDCLSWSAIAFSTKVQDKDVDGLVDIWETSQQTLYDPNDLPLPNLHAMNADPDHPDVFIEIGYLGTNQPEFYGDELKEAHSHRPPYESLKLGGTRSRNVTSTCISMSETTIRVWITSSRRPSPEAARTWTN